MVAIITTITMHILNLYAGVGGNRKLWQDCKITAIELDPKIAALYHRLYPNDTVIQADAHAYLFDHADDFDLIWSSPPCQSHSRMVKASRHKPKSYPDLTLYQQILHLQHHFKGPWVVENVVPYYKPLIEPTTKAGRHLFWSNRNLTGLVDIPRPPNFINRCNVAGKHAMQNWLGIHFPENVYYGDNHCPAQVLRNCVHPLLGKQILDLLLYHNSLDTPSPTPTMG